MRWGGDVADRREKRNTRRFLAGNPEGNITSERPRLKWQYNMKMDFKRTGWREQTELVWLRVGTSGVVL
jgi:hypothetical protein